MIFFHGPKFHRDRKKRLDQKRHATEPAVLIAESAPNEPALPEPGRLEDQKTAAHPPQPGIPPIQDIAGDPSRDEPREESNSDGGDSAGLSEDLPTRVVESGGEQDEKQAPSVNPALVDELSARGVMPSAAMKLLAEAPPGQLERVNDYIEYWDSIQGTKGAASSTASSATDLRCPQHLKQPGKREKAERSKSAHPGLTRRPTNHSRGKRHMRRTPGRRLIALSKRNIPRMNLRAWLNRRCRSLIASRRSGISSRNLRSQNRWHAIPFGPASQRRCQCLWFEDFCRCVKLLAFSRVPVSTQPLHWHRHSARYRTGPRLPTSSSATAPYTPPRCANPPLLRLTISVARTAQFKVVLGPWAAH